MNVPKTILVVEDEWIIAEDLRQRLVQMGHTVIGPASSYEHALKLAVARRPDLVLADINLAGGVDGMAAAELLKERFGVCTLFVTGRPDAAEQLSRKTFVAGVLPKPFTDEELGSALRSALDGADREASVGTRSG